jgi:hypothetical protein
MIAYYESGLLILVLESEFRYCSHLPPTKPALEHLLFCDVALQHTFVACRIRN